MGFDINRLEDIDIAEDENAFYEYQNELLDIFINSPEGQAREKEDPGMAFWARVLIDYGFHYTGATIPRMTEGDVEEIITDIFPRKVSLEAPEHANHALPALIAFWEFLRREYKLANAEDILRYLRSVKQDEFSEWMNDLSKFGMAKSIFTMGQKAGFDMSDEKENEAFINWYNARIASSRQGDLSWALGMGDMEGAPSGTGGARRKADQKAKRRRKLARESRKKNRQRK
jgi:hypothetical protein